MNKQIKIKILPFFNKVSIIMKEVKYFNMKGGKRMRFVKKSADISALEDTVFAMVRKAKEEKNIYGEDQVINASIGSLYGEDGKLVALKSVYEDFKALPNQEIASYASAIKGDADFCLKVKQWVLEDRVSLPYQVIATAGGTGAIYLTIHSMLDEGETLVIPEIGWPSYQLMADMDHLKTVKYSLFDQEDFNLDSFKRVCQDTMSAQQKLCVIINDPCHNPTGYSLDIQTWKEIIAFLNDCAKTGPVILLNDIAYFDYSFKGRHGRDYMSLFNDISDQVMVVVAFSLSKSMTAYGQRCGAAVLLGKNSDDVNQTSVVYEKMARAIWSNVNHGAMKTFITVLNQHGDDYEKEKQIYVDLLQQRSAIFKQEALACGLPIYPYKEGFFLTLKIEDNKKRDVYHEALIKNHIFTVKVNKGIRVGVCSLPIKQCYGLAQKMKEILDTID